MNALFWICLGIDLVFVGVIAYNQLLMYSRRDSSGIPASAWRQGWLYIGLGSALLIGSLALRYIFKYEAYAEWVAIGPPASVIGFGLLGMIAIALGARVN